MNIMEQERGYVKSDHDLDTRAGVVREILEIREKNGYEDLERPETEIGKLGRLLELEKDRKESSNRKEGSKCLYVDKWECPIEGDKVPLEVCNTCLEAKRVALEYKKLASSL